MQTPNLERALAIVSGAKIEHRETGGLVVYLDDTNDANLVPKIVEMYGYQPDPTEVASSNMLHFVETADFDEDEDEDDEESIDDESIDDDSDDEDEDGDDEETEGSTSGGGLNNLDDDGRSLKVLASPESHRFAAKIFQDMLGNENMAGYAAFLQDFDRFLVQHKGKGDIAFGGKRKKDSEISAEDTSDDQRRADMISDAGEMLRKMPELKVNSILRNYYKMYGEDYEKDQKALLKKHRTDKINFILKDKLDAGEKELFKFLDTHGLVETAAEVASNERIADSFIELMEKAYAEDIPWATSNAVDAVVIAAVEVAKKKQKNGRAGLLSALMKAISGDAGDAIVKAWDDGDSEKLKELLGSATDKVAANLGKAKD